IPDGVLVNSSDDPDGHLPWIGDRGNGPYGIGPWRRHVRVWDRPEEIPDGVAVVDKDGDAWFRRGGDLYWAPPSAPEGIVWEDSFQREADAFLYSPFTEVYV